MNKKPDFFGQEVSRAWCEAVQAGRRPTTCEELLALAPTASRRASVRELGAEISEAIEEEKIMDIGALFEMSEDEYRKKLKFTSPGELRGLCQLWGIADEGLSNSDRRDALYARRGELLVKHMLTRRLCRLMRLVGLGAPELFIEKERILIARGILEIQPKDLVSVLENLDSDIEKSESGFEIFENDLHVPHRQENDHLHVVEGKVDGS